MSVPSAPPADLTDLAAAALVEELEARRRELSFAARYAETPRDRAAAAEECAGVELELRELAVELERIDLAAIEREHRDALAAAALRAARRADLRDTLRRHAAHRRELVAEVDGAVNTLVTLFGEWIATGHAMEVLAGELGLDGQRYGNDARASDWLHDRLAAVLPRRFERSLGAPARSLLEVDHDSLQIPAEEAP